MNKLAKPGHKFVITFDLEGGKFAAGEFEGKLALIPIDEHGNLRGVLAWDSTYSIAAWIADFRERNPVALWEGFRNLLPSIGQVRIIQ